MLSENRLHLLTLAQLESLRVALEGADAASLALDRAEDERAETVERGEGTKGAERGEGAEKAERGERAERTERAERGEGAEGGACLRGTTAGWTRAFSSSTGYRASAAAAAALVKSSAGDEGAEDAPRALDAQLKHRPAEGEA